MACRFQCPPKTEVESREGSQGQRVAPEKELGQEAVLGDSGWLVRGRQWRRDPIDSRETQKENGDLLMDRRPWDTARCPEAGGVGGGSPSGNWEQVGGEGLGGGLGAVKERERAGQ